MATGDHECFEVLILHKIASQTNVLQCLLLTIVQVNLLIIIHCKKSSSRLE